MTTEEYMTELTHSLHALGFAEPRIREVLTEVEDHLSQAAAEPIAELGEPGDYALRLQSAEAAEAGAADGWERWAFRADAFAEMNLLDLLGRDGWEVLGVREDAHFDLRRRSQEPQRWAYKRRTGVRRERIEEEMERDGWEPCGTWLVFHYFKRPSPVS